jgi:hypothetical protein
MPATPPEPEGTAGPPEEPINPTEGQGRGPELRPARTRRRRPAPTAKASKRGVYLTDATWERLQLEAIRRKTTASQVAGDVLDRHLPRLSIHRED